MIGNLLDLAPNKVSVDLTQYSTVLMGDTGVGKTTTLMKFLKELVPNKEPFSWSLKIDFRTSPVLWRLRLIQCQILSQLLDS